MDMDMLGKGIVFAALGISVGFNGLLLHVIKQQSEKLSAERSKHTPWNKGKAGYKLGKRKIKVHVLDTVGDLSLRQYSDDQRNAATADLVGINTSGIYQAGV